MMEMEQIQVLVQLLLLLLSLLLFLNFLQEIISIDLVNQQITEQVLVFLVADFLQMEI